MEKNIIKINNNKNYVIQNKDNNIPKNTIKNIKIINGKKSKGYSRVFIKFIKKKNEALKHILVNRFKKWKEKSLKGIFIRKTIIVRISLSRDNILKNKLNSRRLSMNKDSSNNKPKSVDKELKQINKKDNNESHINNIKVKKINEVKTPIKKNEMPDEKTFKRIYKNEKNSLFNNCDKKQNKQNNPIYSQTLPNENQSKKFNKIIIPKNKFINNKNQNDNYKDKKQTPILYTYEPKQLKTKPIYNKTKALVNNSKNYNVFTSPRTRKYQTYNSYSSIRSNNKTPIANQIKIINEKRAPNVNKSYINIKNNFSDAKLLNKNNEQRFTFTKKNGNKYATIDSERRRINYTERRDNYMKSKFDKEALKKGVTTVIQHYLGVMERLDNYSLVDN